MGGDLTTLTELNLSMNGLREIPSSVGNLTALKTLNLNSNELRELPRSIENLASLETLALSENPIGQLPRSLGRLTALTNLELSSMGLTELPSAAAGWVCPARSSASHAPHAPFPSSADPPARSPPAAYGINGTSLPFQRHQWNIAAVCRGRQGGPEPPGARLAGRVRLTRHTAGPPQARTPHRPADPTASRRRAAAEANEICRGTSSLGNLRALTILALGGNQLTEVPDWVGNLAALTTLTVGSNRLTEVPDWVGNLTALTTLDLSLNQLTEVPPSLGNLTALTTLNLSRNRLTELPVELADLLVGEVKLYLAENPLIDPLPELIARGADELATFLRSLRDGVPQYEAKLVLVGEGNVGKTSLVAALKGAPFVAGRPTTHGIEISPITFRRQAPGPDITLRAWDFGGQEVYRITHQFFFSPRALYVVVWHARQGQEHDDVEGWLRRIRLGAGRDSRAIIVATHCAEGPPELDYPRLEQLFPGMLAGAFEVDNRTGSGLEALRKAIAEQAARLPQIGQRISPRWVAVREKVLAQAQAEPQISYREFAEICERHRVTGAEIGTLANLLHDLGLVNYYAPRWPAPSARRWPDRHGLVHELRPGAQDLSLAHRVRRTQRAIGSSTRPDA